MNGFPMNAGQQMDVNFLFAKVLELSEVLKENREKVQGIVNGASELAVSLWPSMLLCGERWSSAIDMLLILCS